MLKLRAITMFFMATMLLSSSAAGAVVASEARNKYQQKDSLASAAADSYSYLPSVPDANSADASIAIGDFANTTSARSATPVVKPVDVDTIYLRIPIGYRCNIKFVVNKDVIDPDYMDNRVQVQGIDEVIAKVGLDRVDSVVVKGQSSPEGSAAINMSLAKGRALALAKYVATAYPQIRSRVVAEAVDEAFPMLREQLKSDRLLSDAVKEKIYAIINSGASTTDKNTQIQKQLGYRTYRYLVDTYYKDLRYTLVVVTHVGKVPIEFEEVTDTLITPHFEFSYSNDAISVPLISRKPDAVEFVTPIAPVVEKEYEYVPFLAVGTNALYDLVTAINVNAQIPIGNHFSVGVDHVFPWWVSKDNSRALQILFPSLFARYWFKNMDNRVLTGLFAGVQAGGGKYDVEPAHKGYQGEFLTAMGEIGYAWSLSKHWTLEASLGLGYFSTDYRYYEAEETDRHLIYQYSGKYTLASPTKANISFVYTFFYKRARKGGNK